MSNATRFLPGLAILALLAACGGGGGGGAASGSTSVTAMQPADGSTRVDIRPTVSVVLSASIDPASVTTAHVQLLSHGYPQRITLSYDDATRTIAVANGTLSHDTSYTLSVSGLVDSAGKAVAVGQASFSTWVNSELGAAAGDGTSLFTVTLDANGRPVKGPDGDPDDAASNYVTYAYLPNGQLSDLTTWTLAGDLKTYVVQRVAHYAYDAHGALQSITTTRDDYAAGAAHSLDTRDTFTYDAYGQQVLDATATAGADGTLGTADDTFSYLSTAYDAQGGITETVTGTRIGSDGLSIPATAVTAYTAYLPATAIDPETWVPYIDPGIDGVWFTSDDVYNEYDEITRDGNGNVTRSVRYRHQNGVRVGAGPAILDYTVIAYDSHGNIVTRTTYDGAGADGVWLTADDEVASVVTYDTAH